MGGAWLLQQLWDRWDYGRDTAYLAQVWPLFKGAAQFFVDTLQDDPHTGHKVTVPSLSPENEHPFGAAQLFAGRVDILHHLLGGDAHVLGGLLEVGGGRRQHLGHGGGEARPVGPRKLSSAARA